ncbi:PREDICTED: deoxyribonuclease-1-like [Branchiostoma belcheri]|uniref:Deoxyribonuclease n=1 Tax=Branchiostoma belcheri TaxID=7741 RepID=A0A6P4YCK2_BRABE|nr:PREDICTED: deoxyribonuclease-1-like [Branchiostoma belcheri]
MKFSSAFLALGVLALSGAGTALKIGAFNIQTFGRSKMSKPEVVEILLTIAERYDILLIQGIRDSTETAIYDFLNQLNGRDGNNYTLLLSPRMGRSSYKEQYGYLYRNDKPNVVEDYHYSDPGDIFHREPFVVRFQSGTTSVQDFVLIPLHADPQDAVAEINRLYNVYLDAVDRWGINDVIILGDLNADCSYVKSADWSNIRIWTDKRFEWLIGNEADTTVKDSSDCAYDRLVIAGSQLQASVVNYGVFNYKEEYDLSQDETEAVSDHYPVEMTIA